MNSPVRSGTGHPWYHPGSDPAVRYGSALSRQLSVPSRPPWLVVTAPPHSAAALALIEALEVLGIFERPVRPHVLRPGNVAGPRDVAAALRSFLRVGRRREQLS